VTSEGKLCVCNEICEYLAKFKRIKNKKGYLDCVKFFQSTLSSGKNFLGKDYGLNIALENQLDLAGSDIRVLRRVECLSPDFIHKMQMSSITHFRWDPFHSSEAV
jgi:hypothetical protein